MKAQVTFFGGLNTIGGINVLVGVGDTAIVFDLGRMPTNFYGWGSGNICPGSHLLKSYLLLKVAPPILSLYDKQWLGDLTVEELERIWEIPVPQFKHVCAFVSHIHQDHMELLPYIAEDITVFMHKEALATYKAVVKSGEYIDTKARLQGLADMESYPLGADMRIQVVELDHDTPGASGILIHAGDEKVFFTGDYRMHGRHNERVKQKMRFLAEQKLTMLITEGTTLRVDSTTQYEANVNEWDLPVRYSQMLEQSKGLVYINILCRNIERVADFVNVTAEYNRNLVMDVQTALLWHSVSNQIEALSGNPAVKDMDTIVLFEDETHASLPYRTVSYRELVNNKDKYAIYLTQKKIGLMSELEKLGQRKDCSHYFHADGNPLNNNDPTLLYWLRELGIVYHFHSTGGHITSKKLTEFVTTIAPKVVVPLHSMNPSIANTGTIPKLLPHYGMTVELHTL